MTDLEADIVELVRKQGFTVIKIHGVHHLHLKGNAFLNLTTMAKLLSHRIDDEIQQAYNEGRRSLL